MDVSKLKVGDKVRIRSWKDLKNEFGLDRNGNINTKVTVLKGSMTKCCGNVYTIRRIQKHDTYTSFDFYETPFIFSDDSIEPVKKNYSIVIYANGNVVTAVDKVTGKTAEAFCDPDDKFDFYTGADIAFERLRGRKEAPKAREEAPKYFTGEVICTYSGGYFTKGRIYKIENGVITRDSGLTDRGLKSVEQLNHLHSSQFIEIVK